MKIVFISDTHSLHEQVELPEGDILIHAGDATMMGCVNEIAAFGAWFRAQAHKYKVFVAGNHDWMFQKDRMMAINLLNNGLVGGERKNEIIYLEDSGTVIEGLKIYGSPWQPTFFDWAFNLNRGEAIRRKWDIIPEDQDILITHGAPMGIRDQSSPHLGSDHLGDEELMAAIEQTKPKISVFGHIHGGYGKTQHVNTLFINAAICNEAYQAVNDPIVIEVPDAQPMVARCIPSNQCFRSTALYFEEAQ